MKSDKTRIILYGLGPIGIRTAKVILTRPELEIVAGIDKAREKVGKDLGRLLGLDQHMGMSVSDNPEEVFSHTEVDVVVHTTCSFFKEVYPQIEEIILAGINCVSSSEELFFPSLRNPHLAEKLDTLAREYKVSVVGSGVNPGFVMDILSLLLTAVCERVDRIRIERVLDASTRRLSLQKKIGATLTPEEFRKKVDNKTLGHVGLVESLAFLAQNLGWKLEKVEERINPVIATESVSTQFLTVKRDEVAGIKHVAQGLKNGNAVISLDLQMYIGASNPHDLISIEGSPPLNIEIKGGIPGDIATAAILVNSIPLVLQAEPGLINLRHPMMPHWKTGVSSRGEVKGDSDERI